ncbi:response regulator [Rhodohalobacter halophilus]|uniref:response regulator n=1 Tax=Rhodohalobacter halophilus TaxID=1812810 RepID=UPI00083F89B7|nr:response regulator [Rhodohalobacter halophilus]
MKTKKSKGSVLVVEDDMLLSLVETRIIEKLGYTVIGKATSGEAAVKKVKSLNPDVIVMDIGLNGEMNGIDASRKIRAFADTPIIFLSGDSNRESIKDAKKAGNSEYLIKPIKADDIMNPLKRAVKVRKESRRISQAS